MTVIIFGKQHQRIIIQMTVRFAGVLQCKELEELEDFHESPDKKLDVHFPRQNEGNRGNKRRVKNENSS